MNAFISGFTLRRKNIRPVSLSIRGNNDIPKLFQNPGFMVICETIVYVHTVTKALNFSKKSIFWLCCLNDFPSVFEKFFLDS